MDAETKTSKGNVVSNGFHSAAPVVAADEVKIFSPSKKRTQFEGYCGEFGKNEKRWRGKWRKRRSERYTLQIVLLG
jgi:hypothetical protein